MTEPQHLRSVSVTRYITPLREGGSLPAIAEADDGFKYVIKFRGAGQGVKALIAELIGSEMARILGLRVPELVYAHLDEAFGRSERDEEIQDLLKFSRGLNLGLHYLSGAITYDPLVTEIDAQEASRIVWLDAFLTNIDRTFNNTNMLSWRGELWLIDHGAALYFHHQADQWEQQIDHPFPRIADHVLLDKASELEEADRYCSSQLPPKTLQALVSLIPDDWLQWRETDRSPDQIRTMYVEYLTRRMQYSQQFVKTAQDARSAII